MKIVLAILIVVTGFAISSCEKTTKESSKSADTMVMKKDTAIKRTDTAGYHK